MTLAHPAHPPRESQPFEGGAYTNRAAALDALAERVALRVVELLTDRDEAPLLDAADVARQLGRSREWVYRHADELGAVRLGDGARPRLGFDRARVAAYLSACQSGMRTEPPAEPSAERSPRRRKAGTNGQGADLLPIRGEAPCP